MEIDDFEGSESSNIEGSRVSPLSRSKSALRIKYDAETAQIRRKLGDLESIREKLGISQRRICQLLLVDPSAWTRWTRDGDSAPPHVYRMLQWYLALEEKYPALDVNFWVSAVSRQGRDLHFEEKTRENDRNLKVLETEVEELRRKLFDATNAAEKRERNLWIALAACGLGLFGILIAVI